MAYLWAPNTPVDGGFFFCLSMVSAASRAFAEQGEIEVYRELKALLKLLTQLTQRDVTERGQGTGVDVAQ
eukprot:scaffold281362_cov18-Prasinocladus_malaysianus.AAC.1